MAVIESKFKTGETIIFGGEQCVIVSKNYNSSTKQWLYKIELYDSLIPENKISKLKLINMNTNRDLFFQKLKVELFTKFTQLQVDSINGILDEIELQGITDSKHKAYIFATAYHEAYDFSGNQTGAKQRIVPIMEGGGLTYLKSKKYYPYVGYGFVQLTWDYNFKKMQSILSKLERFKGIDIVKNPKEALRIDVASFVLVYGMKHGIFTGKKLSTYNDFFSMRRLINGTDKASLIASIANKFLKCFD